MRTIFASLLLVSACAVADDSDLDANGGGGKADDAAACTTREVRRIERPVIPGASKSKKFSYAFRVSPGTDPNAPTVIFLPGGPGQTSIEMAREDLAVPPRYTVVFTDPRGVGCNAPARGEQFPDDFFTSANLASDVVALVNELKPSSYMLYGISYGTLLGTTTAAQLDAAKVAPPIAVVLEGVVTRAFQPGEEAAEYSRQWAAALARQAPEIQRQFTGDTLPLGLDAKAWGGAISQWLSMGTITGTGNLLDMHLGALTPGQSQMTLDAVKMGVEQYAAGSAHSSHAPQLLHLFERVGCREITETNFDLFHLTGGKLQPVGDVCSRFDLATPYDAKDHPVRSPIFYLNGERDPNTPHTLALAHVAAQPQTDRAFISVPDGGHNPFSLSLGGCAPALWSSFEARGAGLEQALATCEAATKLQRFPAAR
ncbi:MAG: alpha/beta hydrolase [Myxococcota bacterium]|nr:alpha/beta hydrolase [Myxococcota bacterium]